MIPHHFGCDQPFGQDRFPAKIIVPNPSLIGNSISTKVEWALLRKSVHGAGEGRQNRALRSSVIQTRALLKVAEGAINNDTRTRGINWTVPDNMGRRSPSLRG